MVTVSLQEVGDGALGDGGGAGGGGVARHAGRPHGSPARPERPAQHRDAVPDHRGQQYRSTFIHDTNDDSQWISDRNPYGELNY